MQVEVFGGLACGRHNITTEIPKTIMKEPKRAADEVLHATTNLQGADNEGQGKFEELVFPCQMIQWRWFSKFPFLTIVFCFGILLAFSTVKIPLFSNSPW